MRSTPITPANAVGLHSPATTTRRMRRSFPTMSSRCTDPPVRSSPSVPHRPKDGRRCGRQNGACTEALGAARRTAHPSRHQHHLKVRAVPLLMHVEPVQLRPYHPTIVNLASRSQFTFSQRRCLSKPALRTGWPMRTAPIAGNSFPSGNSRVPLLPQCNPEHKKPQDNLQSAGRGRGFVRIITVSSASHDPPKHFACARSRARAATRPSLSWQRSRARSSASIWWCPFELVASGPFHQSGAVADVLSEHRKVRQRAREAGCLTNAASASRNH